MTSTMTAAELKTKIREGSELAILDVRDQGDFSTRHFLFSSCLPLSRLELHICQLVPRLGVPIVLIDDGGGLATRSAEKLDQIGYSRVSILQGGVQAWQDEGYEIFSGVSVLSKAFGEFVERINQTPSISPQELQARRAASENIAVLDSRPFDEFLRMAIPGGINVPGAELAYRACAAVPDPTTEIVVNCAGRTRSIIGAQSLINAGIPNPVRALRNGTMGWHLAGFELEQGATRRAPSLLAPDIDWARIAADRVAGQVGIKLIDCDALEHWRSQAEERSLYLFDVRSHEEYRSAHVPGSIHAPGGQLVQNTDSYIATLNARIVLIDDTGLRATMTASWLHQMGLHGAVVLRGGLNAGDLVQGDFAPDIPGLSTCDVEPICASVLLQMLEIGGVTVVDLSLSPAFNAGHIPGAWYSTRAKLADTLKTIALTDLLVLTSEDGNLARLAAAEINPPCPVRYLWGGMTAWRNAGLKQATGFENMAHEPNDYYVRAFEHESGLEKAMQSYLTWEVGLTEQIERDGDARFNIIVPGA